MFLVQSSVGWEFLKERSSSSNGKCWKVDCLWNDEGIDLWLVQRRWRIMEKVECWQEDEKGSAKMSSETWYAHTHMRTRERSSSNYMMMMMSSFQWKREKEKTNNKTIGEKEREAIWLDDSIPNRYSSAWDRHADGCAYRTQPKAWKINSVGQHFIEKWPALLNWPMDRPGSIGKLML